MLLLLAGSISSRLTVNRADLCSRSATCSILGESSEGRSSSLLNIKSFTSLTRTAKVIMASVLVYFHGTSKISVVTYRFLFDFAGQSVVGFRNQWGEDTKVRISIWVGIRTAVK